MKKVLSIVAMAIGLTFAAQAQEASPVGPSISVDKDVHDYGEIEKGGDPYCEFVVTNTGTEPLIISNARGSCGCTVPEWSKDPILPGKTSTIKVRYDTKRVGPINKSVTLTTNAVNEPTKVLRIKGNVKAAPAEGAPVKAAEGAAAPIKNDGK